MENQTEQVQSPSQHSITSKTLLFFVITAIILVLLSAIVGYKQGQRIVQGKTVLIKNQLSNKTVPKKTVKEMVPSPVDLNPQASQTPSISPAQYPVWTPSAVQLSDPNTVVQNYYNWYVACQNAISQTNFGYSSKSCSFNKPGVLTDNLVNKLQKPVDYEPVLCVQNAVDYVTFDKAVIANNGTATVTVYQEPWHSNNGQAGYISVGLQEIKNQWEIASITCQD